MLASFSRRLIPGCRLNSRLCMCSSHKTVAADTTACQLLDCLYSSYKYCRAQNGYASIFTAVTNSDERNQLPSVNL